MLCLCLPFSRAAQFLKVMSDPHMLQESQNLSMFLATQNRIRDTLKETLAKIPNSEDLICEVINLAVYMFENKMYLTPAEKHMLVKVRPRQGVLFYLLFFRGV